MANNQLVPFKPQLPAVLKKESKEPQLTIVKYEPIDSQHYSFSYTLADDVEMRMDLDPHSASNPLPYTALIV